MLFGIIEMIDISTISVTNLCQGSQAGKQLYLFVRTWMTPFFWVSPGSAGAVLQQQLCAHHNGPGDQLSWL